MEHLKVEITFSPSARAALESVAGPVPPSAVLYPPLDQVALFAQAQDQLVIPGLPEDLPLYVCGRALTLAVEGSHLLLVLGLQQELR